MNFNWLDVFTVSMQCTSRGEMEDSNHLVHEWRLSEERQTSSKERKAKKFSWCKTCILLFILLISIADLLA